MINTLTRACSLNTTWGRSLLLSKALAAKNHATGRRFTSQDAASPAGWPPRGVFSSTSGREQTDKDEKRRSYWGTDVLRNGYTAIDQLG